MTSVPAALDYLVAQLRAELPDEHQVFDGHPLEQLEPDGLAIGFTPDQIAVESQESGAGLKSDTEIYDINCHAWAWSGDELAKPVRDRVFATVAAVDALVKSDRRLGGAVVFAQVKFVDFDQVQRTDGAWAVVAFAVSCQAFK